MPGLDTSKTASVRAFSEVSNRDPPHTGFSKQKGTCWFMYWGKKPKHLHTNKGFRTAGSRRSVSPGHVLSLSLSHSPASLLVDFILSEASLSWWPLATPSFHLNRSKCIRKNSASITSDWSDGAYICLSGTVRWDMQCSLNH